MRVSTRLSLVMRFEELTGVVFPELETNEDKVKWLDGHLLNQWGIERPKKFNSRYEHVLEFAILHISREQSRRRMATLADKVNVSLANPRSCAHCTHFIMEHEAADGGLCQLFNIGWGYGTTSDGAIDAHEEYGEEFTFWRMICNYFIPDYDAHQAEE